MKRLLPLVAIGLLICAGCATSPILNEDAELVYTSPQKGDNAGKVVIKRDTGILGSGAKLYVYVDAQPIIGLKAGQKAELWLSAGQHMLAVHNKIDGNIVEAEAVVVAGKERAYRISTSFDSGLSLMPTAF